MKDRGIARRLLALTGWSFGIIMAVTIFVLVFKSTDYGTGTVADPKVSPKGGAWRLARALLPE
jgi:hypothetical protein